VLFSLVYLPLRHLVRLVACASNELNSEVEVVVLRRSPLPIRGDRSLHSRRRRAPATDDRGGASVALALGGGGAGGAVVRR
jgi:hypothetical protein